MSMTFSQHGSYYQFSSFLLCQTRESFQGGKGFNNFTRARIGNVHFFIAPYHSPLILFLFSILRRLFLFNFISDMSDVNCNTFILFFDNFERGEFELAF